LFYLFAFRVRTVIPFTELAHTLDVSVDGAKIGGISSPVELGDVIEIQYRHRRASFRIIWIKSPNVGARVLHAGVSCTVEGKNIWGIEENAEFVDHAGSIADVAECGPAAAQERRMHRRYSITATAEVRNGARAILLWGSVADISMGGCYVETMYPLDVGVSVDLILSVNGATVPLSAVVKTSHPTVGMGLAFVPPVPAAWIDVIRNIEDTEQPVSGPTEVIGNAIEQVDKPSGTSAAVCGDLGRAEDLLGKQVDGDVDPFAVREAIACIRRARRALQASSPVMVTPPSSFADDSSQMAQPFD
jgi:hypothetical protein